MFSTSELSAPPASAGFLFGTVARPESVEDALAIDAAGGSSAPLRAGTSDEPAAALDEQFTASPAV
jgi:hypothetical protein